ncbi:MAG: DUF1614 domain-containing protein [Thermoplasmata archaeon]|nr:DUF1614 domain-containing protein [Thermoplasmata archaeon]
MVDLAVLVGDVISQIGASIPTPLLWIGLFLWAWSRPAQALASGFGRMTFWLLLPGAFLASLADAPFLPWAGDVLAINIGGALIPVLLSIVLLRRELTLPRWVLTSRVLLVVAAEAAIQFAIVLVVPSRGMELLVTVTAAGAVVFAILVFQQWAPRPLRPRATTLLGRASSALARLPGLGRVFSALARLPGLGRVFSVLARVFLALGRLPIPTWTFRPPPLRAITVVGLVSAAITITFATSSAVPGVGIVSAFPLYMIGPAVVGAFSVVLAVTLWRVSPFQGLGAGYASATLGTLIGADVLREPPLYAGGSGGLLAIGGAGIQDLVYFSGLLAVGAGLLVILVQYRESLASSAATAPSVPSPDQALHTAAQRLASGDPAGAVRNALTASQGAAERARSAWQLPAPSQPAAAWDGLPVASYVLSDYRNFVAATDQPTPTPGEAFREVAMAAQFVRLGRDLSRLRFAPLGRRAWAVMVDLAVVTAPAVVLWSFLALTLRGSPTTILAGLPFNLAVYAFIAYALLYFVVCDALFGATPGKHLWGLRVTDRNRARPTFLQSLLRESPKAVSLFVIGQIGAPAILFVVRAGVSPISTLGVSLTLLNGVVLLGIVGAVVLGALSVGAVQIARNSERQRLGDRWAATWVVDRRVVTPAWGARLAPPPVPSGPAPPG